MTAVVALFPFDKNNIALKLDLAANHVNDDPTIALTKCRTLLEEILKKLDQAEGYGLNERITSLNGQISDTIVTQMHFIRKMGNIGTHASSDANKQSCSQCIASLISVICWFYNIKNTLPTLELVESKLTLESEIPVAKKILRARFFIADEIYKTWSKIAILTSDGSLYNEYLHFMNPRTFKCEGINFIQFQVSEFSFGSDEHGHGYQSLREVTQEQAQEFKLTRQHNWVADYLDKLCLK